MDFFKAIFREVLAYRKQAMAISAIVLLIGLGGIAFQGGVLYGIDFTGGLQLLLEFDRPLSAERVKNVRGVFSRNFSSSQVQTVTLQGEEERRGVIVTVRAAGLVDRLANHLYEAGRSGAERPYESFTQNSENQVLSVEDLQDNFALGTPDDESKIDLTRASQDTIRSRVQSLVNQNISERVLTILRQEFVPDEDGIDLNWANEDEIQTWLANQQTDSFVDQVVNLRESNELSREALVEQVNRYGLSSESFFEIFELNGDNPDRLDIAELEPENFRDVVHEEFFRGRYGDVANQVMQTRNDRGIFRSQNDVLQLDALDNVVTSNLKENFYLSPFIIKSREMISPSIGAELITNAALAILLSMVGILIYLYVRFELNYSFGAIGAIVHDVLITVGLLTLLGVEFNVPVVAAVLTVIGYSLNDTIVNFDRVRENRVLMGYEASWYDVINRSVHEVLNRTFVTSLTTFIAALVLYLYGGIALRGFSITLLIGVVAGTFSSIYVSNLLLYELQSRFE